VPPHHGTTTRRGPPGLVKPPAGPRVRHGTHYRYVVGWEEWLVSGGSLASFAEISEGKYDSGIAVAEKAWLPWAVFQH